MITDFRGNYWFLSNFSGFPTVLDGILCPTVEHAYQAAKTLDSEQRRYVLNAETPADAKKRGRSTTLRSDWEDVKVTIMYELVQIKFLRSRPLQNRLLATGDQTLVEGNTWDDRVWGAVWENGQWVGENMLGQILMQVRAELELARQGGRHA
jgi:hypothetical protein